MENIQNILNRMTTKTNKIKMLLELGMTRKQVAEAMGIGYGFVQNVYASVYGVAHPRRFFVDRFSFDRTFGVEMEIIHNSETAVWKRLYKNYAALESAIDSFMPPSRRNNSYCRSLKVAGWSAKIDGARNLEDLERKVTGRSRYFKLNSQSYWRHHTVEFRQHSGSVEFEKVKNWILFCARFVEFSKKNTVASEEKSELKKFLSDDLVSFYNNRAARFAA